MKNSTTVTVKLTLKQAESFQTIFQGTNKTQQFLVQRSLSPPQKRMNK